MKTSPGNFNENQSLKPVFNQSTGNFNVSSAIVPLLFSFPQEITLLLKQTNYNVYT